MTVIPIKAPLRLARGLLAAVLVTHPLSAQAPDDGVLMSRKALSLGVVYTHESWSEYWEGTLKRSNDNIGTLTTQSFSIVGHYGVTDRLTLVGVLPDEHIVSLRSIGQVAPRFRGGAPARRLIL